MLPFNFIYLFIYFLKNLYQTPLLSQAQVLLGTVGSSWALEDPPTVPSVELVPGILFLNSVLPLTRLVITHKKITFKTSGYFFLVLPFSLLPQ